MKFLYWAKMVKANMPHLTSDGSAFTIIVKGYINVFYNIDQTTTINSQLLHSSGAICFHDRPLSVKI